MDDTTSIDEQTQLFALMGMTLNHVQQVEMIINKTLLFVIQEGDYLDKNGWEKQKKLLTRKTLGQMIKILKDRVVLHECFEEFLASFLRDRNILAHNLDSVKDYDLETSEGRAAMRSFLTDLFDNATHLQKIFISIGISWQEQVGIFTPADSDVREFVGDYYLNFSEFLFCETAEKEI